MAVSADAFLEAHSETRMQLLRYLVGDSVRFSELVTELNDQRGVASDLARQLIASVDRAASALAIDPEHRVLLLDPNLTRILDLDPNVAIDLDRTLARTISRTFARAIHPQLDIAVAHGLDIALARFAVVAAYAMYKDAQAGVTSGPSVSEIDFIALFKTAEELYQLVASLLAERQVLVQRLADALQLVGDLDDYATRADERAEPALDVANSLVASFTGLERRLAGELTAIKGVTNSPVVPDENARRFSRRALFGMSTDAVATVAATAALTGVTVDSSSSDAADVVKAIQEQTATASEEHRHLMDALMPVLEKSAELSSDVEENDDR